MTAEILERYLEITDANLPKEIDPGIRKTIQLLNIWGFVTTQSCEGHELGTKNFDTSKRFWPFIVLNLSSKLVIEGDKIKKLPGNLYLYEQRRRLHELVVYFKCLQHPFQKKDIGLTYDVNSDIIAMQEEIEKGWGVEVTIRNKSAQILERMPNELITDEFRKDFLEQSQDEMHRFTQFLEWYLFHQED